MVDSFERRQSVLPKRFVLLLLILMLAPVLVVGTLLSVEGARATAVGATPSCPDGTCLTTGESGESGEAGAAGITSAEANAGAAGFGLFSTDGFVPRWECGAFSPLHGWTHIVADVLTFGAYVSIPLLLLYFTRKRRDIPFSSVFWLFGLFIFACGAGHLIEATLFAQPWYRLSAAVKLLTALASWATVAALIPILPKALALPGLARVNAQLHEEVARRAEAEREVQTINSQLRATNEEMERFVYTVSHDLKSPIVTIDGFLGFIEADLREGDMAAVQDSIGRIRQGADRMVRTINDLLELSRVGRVKNSPEPVHVTAMVRELVEQFEPQLREKNLSIDVQPGMPKVEADPVRLREVFQNLLSNALKYGCVGDAPRVAVGAEVRDDEVRFFVRDRGKGLDPAYKDRVFELFERCDTEQDGTGVGLAIVRRVMDVHGGRAWVESQPGDGATFWIALPASALCGPDAAPRSDADVPASLDAPPGDATALA